MSALARFADSDRTSREVREAPTIIAVAAPPAGNSARAQRGGAAAGDRNRIHARIARLVGDLDRPESLQPWDLLGVTHAEQWSPGMRTMGSGWVLAKPPEREKN
jgi:hypothetical protein